MIHHPTNSTAASSTTTYPGAKPVQDPITVISEPRPPVTVQAGH
jgi:hypothetical protein